jgi:hypothetical protein
MTLIFVTREKSPNTTLFEFATHLFNYFCLAIRPTDSLKGTKLLFERITASSIPTSSSPLTSVSVMTNSPSALPSGSPVKALYRRALFSLNAYVVSLIPILPDNLYELGAPRHSQRMESPLQLSKPSVDGLLMPSRST